MNTSLDTILENFGNKLRIRVCGICIENDKILMVNHQYLNNGGDFWGPPGGGMVFGASAEENLKREFLEETGLTIKIEKFLFVHEYLKPPLHAIELVFKVTPISGNLIIGFDPEMGKTEQIISDVQYISMDNIKKLGKSNVHQMFNFIGEIESIDSANGYFRWND